MAATDFVNISFGERSEQGNPASESTDCRKQIANPASPSKKNDQSSKSYPQMQLAKKGLEKLSRDIRLGIMVQQNTVESGSKTMPYATLPQNSRQNAPPNQTTEFQALWDELHKIQVQYNNVDLQNCFTNLTDL